MLPDNLFIGEALAPFDIVLKKSAHAGHADSSRMPGWNEIPNVEVAVCYAARRNCLTRLAEFAAVIAADADVFPAEETVAGAVEKLSEVNDETPCCSGWSLSVMTWQPSRRLRFTRIGDRRFVVSFPLCPETVVNTYSSAPGFMCNPANSRRET